MSRNKFGINELIDLLIKKASGFYYTEEQYEYEKTQNKQLKHKNQCQNLSFFDNCDRGITEFDNSNDTIKLSNENEQTNATEQTKNLTIVKKKVTTHYVSPDINAIKILFEIFEKKVGESSLENLTDNELLDLKNKLIKELSNENYEN